MKPYQDLKNQDNLIVREFSESIDQIDLMWHRDLNNREIKSEQTTDWKIQLENELPVEISKNYIPALQWHRVIKGSGNLILTIREW